MKKISNFLLILTLPFVASFPSCDKVEELLTFGFNIKGEFDVPPNIPVNIPFNLPSVPMDYNAEEMFAQNNTKPDMVKEIKLDYIEMTVLEPIGQDFTFVKDIEIYLDKDGLGPKLVAWKYDVSDSTGQKLRLDVTPDALDNYLKSDGLKLKLNVTTDKMTSSTVKVSYDIRSRVTANVFD
jgi:hypothetical protein